MRARITELDVSLEELRIRVNRAKTQARLLFLQEETAEVVVSEQGELP